MITPSNECLQIAKFLGIKGLFIKREDLHPLLSHKGRSIPKMIDKAIENNFFDFVISSSGNAGLASALYAKELNKNGKKISIKIFVGKNINNEKFEKIKSQEDENIIIEKTDRPLQNAISESKKGKYLLRQSTDPNATLGYSELAKEILEIKNISDVFLATSSGASAEGIAKHFLKIESSVSVHIVQTSSCHPISNALGGKTEKIESVLADAIVDKIAHRKISLVRVIKELEGLGIIAENQIIEEAQKMLERENIITTPNGALALAGLIKALKNGLKPERNVVCVLGGK